MSCGGAGTEVSWEETSKSRNVSPFKLTQRTLPAGRRVSHPPRGEPAFSRASQIPQLSDHAILMEPPVLPTSPSLSPSPSWLEIDVQGSGELRSTSQCVPILILLPQVVPLDPALPHVPNSSCWEMVPRGGMSQLVFIASLTLARVT